MQYSVGRIRELLTLPKNLVRVEAEVSYILGLQKGCNAASAAGQTCEVATTPA